MPPEPVMERLSQLPPPPLLRLEILEDRSPPGDGFLRRRSRVVRLLRADGSPTRSLIYDEVDREALDAVVIAAHFIAPVEAGGSERYVVLRSAARPPVMLRDERRSPMPEPDNRGLWELPAGLVEVGEQSEEGLRRCAARELLEEAGFSVAPSELRALGPSAYPSPGMVAERHFFFEIEVDPTQQTEPPLDGSPLEEEGQLIAVPLRVALEAARQGRVEDAKTELALRRLWDLEGVR